MDVDQLAQGTSCKVESRVAGSSTIVQQTLTSGAHAYNFTNVTPGKTVNLVQVQCSGGQTTDIDWLSVQNVNMPFAPMMDMDSHASPMKLPWSGDMHFVRTSRHGDYVFAGSSVGGFAWSTDGETWEFGNGSQLDFVDHGDLGVWDFYFDESAGAVPRGALASGHQKDASAGGLWTGDPEGGDWTEVFTSTGLGFGKHFDECGGDAEGGQTYSSGKLLLHDDDDSQLSSLYILSQASPARGVYYTPDFKTATTICQPYDPLSLPADALPRAGAIVRDDADVGWLLLGYGARYSSSDAGMSGLYACPLATTGSTSCPAEELTCFEVDDLDAIDEEALDVRDIDVNPSLLMQAYMADGGRRGNGDGTCDQQGGTVYAINIYNDGASNPPIFELWDTDATDTSQRPSWSTDPDNGDAWVAYNWGAGGAGGRHGCYPQIDSSQMIGDLVPPGPGTNQQQIVSVAMSPDADYLFAFYPLGDGTLTESCVRHFRSAMPEAAFGPRPLAADELLGWQPLMDYSDRDDYWTEDFNSSAAGLQNGAADRRAHINVNDAFLHNEPMPEIYDGYMFDAAFFDDGDAEYPYRLLLGSQWSWWIPQTNAAVPLGGGTIYAVGWDADRATADLDMIYEGMGTLVERSFQDASVRDVAIVPMGDDESGTSRDVLLTAAADVHLFTAYGHETPASRAAADRDCHFSGTGVAAGSVDTWYPGARDSSSDLEYEAWYAPALVDANDAHDQDGFNLLFHHRLADDWCWDGVAKNSRAALEYDATGTAWGLQCVDLQEVNAANGWWHACNSVSVAEVDAFGLIDVGVITDIVALGHDFALVAAIGRCGDSDATDSNTDELCPSGSGEGLWLVHDSGADGLTYTEIPWTNAPNNDTGGTPASVTRQAYFEGVSSSGIKRGNVSLSLHPQTLVLDEGGWARVFLSSHTSGVRSVTFAFDAAGAVGSVVWTQYPITNCVFNLPFNPTTVSNNGTVTPQTTIGVTVSPDAQYFMVYGGSSVGNQSVGGGVCQVELYGSKTRRIAIGAAALRQAITSVVPHPDIEGLYAVTTYQDSDCNTTAPNNGCGDAGVYWLQRRNVGTGLLSTNWAWARMSDDSLDHPRGMGAAWGRGRGATSTADAAIYDHLYAGMSGGGPWDLGITW